MLSTQILQLKNDPDMPQHSAYFLTSLDTPLPFLFGSLFGCLIASLAGIELRGMPKVSSISRTVLGVAIGTTLTWDVITTIPQYALTLAMVPLYVVAISSVGYPYFRKILKYDRVTAYYASMPGGLQDMIVFGIEAEAIRGHYRLSRDSLFGFDHTGANCSDAVFWIQLDNPLGSPITELPLVENVGLLLTGIAGMMLFKKMKLFGADILGPLMLAAPLAMSGILTALDHPRNDYTFTVFHWTRGRHTLSGHNSEGTWQRYHRRSRLYRDHCTIRYCGLLDRGAVQ